MPGSVLRGTPIYLTIGQERIALVPEVRRTGRKLRRGLATRSLITLTPSALYVIDRRGVRRVHLGPTAKPNMVVIVLAYLLGPLLHWLMRPRRTNG
jgi:hypothetical protein